MARRRWTAMFFVTALHLGACHAILGLDDPTVEGQDAAADARSDVEDEPMVEGPSIDGGLDGSKDADAEPEVVVNYNENWDNPTLWNKIDLSTFNGGVTAFAGAVFDGRYIYFAPSNNTNAVAFAARYDTLGNLLTVNTSWSFFDTGSLHPDARGFQGAFFDGQYVYFVPFAGPTAHTGRIVRYDTKAGRQFSDALAWSHFDTTSLNANAKGFIGGAFDGQKYAYMAPGLGSFDAGQREQAIAARFDVTAPNGFSSAGGAGAWQFFDTQTIDPLLSGGGPRGFFGTVHTGSHLYFAPFGYGGGLPDACRGRVVRYDAAKSFTAKASWELFDTSTVDSHAVCFQGAAYDGRHVYFVPLIHKDDYSGAVTRYDTTKAFTQAQSWNVFDVGTLDGGVAASQLDGGAPVVRKGYVGATFDGRYLYLVPNQSPGAHGWIARFDTTKASLEDATAWSFYDATRAVPRGDGTPETDAVAFVGAVFDGQYVYLIPGFKAVVVRFYAAYPAKLPKFMRAGSFF